MTEKEYTIHKMIEGCNMESDCINSYVKELIERNEFVEDVTVDILHNGKNMTYKECCEVLNQLTEENKYLREKIDKKIKDETDLGLTYGDIVNIKFLQNLIDFQNEQITELSKEKYDLINEVTKLKYRMPKEFNESEIRDAVWELNKHYRTSMSKMDFHDILLIENLLMTFERILFVGDVKIDTNKKE